jgi:hypothetical protein
LIKARGDLLNRQEAEAQQAFEASQARIGEGMSHDGDSGGVGDQ